MPIYHFAGMGYLLDVNLALPNVQTSKDEEIGGNKVDARWVDMQLARYIDITAIEMREGSKLCSGRKIDMRIIGGMSPLQRSAFVGLEVYVPAGTERMLPQEYAESALMVKVFRGYEF
jgi:hypothetical protein